MVDKVFSRKRILGKVPAIRANRRRRHGGVGTRVERRSVEVQLTYRFTTIMTDIHQQIDNFSARIDDLFVTKMMVGAQRVLLDIENPTRIHLFALSVREVMSYLLHKLAPDEDVKACQWFQPVTENGAPSRIQRAEYAIRGGLSADDFPDLSDIESEAKAKLKDRIDDLNKLTHVRPNTHIEDPEEIAQVARETIFALSSFLDLIEAYRTEVQSIVAESIDSHVFETFLWECFPEVDILSTHSRVEHATINEVTVTKIDSSAVYFRADGDVEVELNYGSGGDRRRGEGASLNENFPFHATFVGELKDMKALKDPKYEIDTSSWYE